MASVTSLDKDLRKLRLDKYTPAAANETKSWIENILGERLPASDLLDGLKDGVALCKLANLALPPPGIKFKKSAMPFIQMENISHFLRACQSPPLSMPDHDMFLTVDLYEQKDPAQVLQCLGAFSRAANRVNPSAFPSAIGTRAGGGRGVLSPQSTGPATPTGRNDIRGRGISNASNASSAYGRGAPTLTASRTGDSGSGRWSPTKSPTNNGSASPPVGVTSSWSTRAHEGATSPAWNIAQYGYMGGASQGALGIAFGGRRQITSAGPHVPSLAEKEKKRREAEAQRQQMEEEERQRREEIEAEEERARLEEERRWEEEARRAREAEARRIEEEKRKWEEEEREWKAEEERRKREEEEAERMLKEERTRSRGNSDARLRGQFLSQYQAEQGVSPATSQRSGYGDRIKELEKELELARQREAEYERERQGRSSRRKPDTPEDRKSKARSRSRPASRPPSRQDSWRPKDDRGISVSPIASPHMQQDSRWSQPSAQQDYLTAETAPPPPPRSPRPLPDPKTAAAPPPSAPLKKQRTGEQQQPPLPVRKHHTGSRPLPDPTTYSSTPPSSSSVRSPQPASIPPAIRSPPTNIRTPQNNSPFARPDRYGGASPSQAQGAPKPAPKKQSLLEREMELERQRQREWEEAQKETATMAARGEADGVGGRWDVSQWSGYTGGDGQNKGAQGIGAGRRQIVGPRPLPGAPR
ncbi:hypothetical protein GE09DRAFT_1159778 [Coniochaeta sp. 2T2.1]|nr:hypothetical protein GE09DRAFT_1159778 [Coniochaeta sp. 2T2.1]